MGVEEVGSAPERKASVYSLRNKSGKIGQMVAAMEETQAACSFLETGCGCRQLFGSGRTTLFGLNNL